MRTAQTTIIEKRTIIEKLTEIHNTVKQEVEQSETSALGELLSDLAIQAILQGKDSPAWETYMRKIVGNNAPNQLARLMFKDDYKTEPYVVKNNAYIVSNAVCGSHTKTNTLANVETTGPDNIDRDLIPEP